MARRIEVTGQTTLAEYASVAHLAPAVRALEVEGARMAASLVGRTVWMVNSTPHGGGVAEMLPAMVSLLREIGLAAEWLVLEADDPAFFDLTKRIHNLIHGAGDPRLTEADRQAFERVAEANARRVREIVKPGDLLVVHDPQPVPLAGLLADAGLTTVWRCHIGLDEENAATRAAWDFLAPYLVAYDAAVFSAPEYVPDSLADRAIVVSPAIDPLSPKNRELPLHKLVGTLANGGLAVSPGPRVTAPYPWLARRLQPDGSWAPANAQEDIGLLTRPIVTQVSRWDRLKGFLPLMRAFASLKRMSFERDGLDPVQERRLDLVRLVLAGPDPASIVDDPEGQEVLAELTTTYLALEPAIQDAVAIVTLPMQDRRQNALLVNALQRASTVVVQNSLREGFGLTVTEAMWKHVPVLSNRRACGPRQQVRDGLDGRLVDDPEDEGGLERTLEAMLGDPLARDGWGRSAQRRAHEEFLVFSQLRRWLALLADLPRRQPLRAAGA